MMCVRLGQWMCRDPLVKQLIKWLKRPLCFRLASYIYIISFMNEK